MKIKEWLALRKMCDYNNVEQIWDDFIVTEARLCDEKWLPKLYQMCTWIWQSKSQALTYHPCPGWRDQFIFIYINYPCPAVPGTITSPKLVPTPFRFLSLSHLLFFLPLIPTLSTRIMWDKRRAWRGGGKEGEG